MEALAQSCTAEQSGFRTSKMFMPLSGHKVLEFALGFTQRNTFLQTACAVVDSYRGEVNFVAPWTGVGLVVRLLSTELVRKMNPQIFKIQTTPRPG